MPFTIVGKPAFNDPSMRPNTGFGMVTPDFFKTFGVRMVNGRSFTDQDTEGMPGVAVVSESLVRRPLTAGAVFVGPFAAQAAGDYATGSNHVLPTAGAARFRGGLSAADFVRVMNVQRITRAGLARLAPIVVPLARAEGLTAHAESIEARL